MLQGRLQRDDAAMNESAYSRFGKGKLILRDELAIDRTLLANERTLLAYLRSGIALMIAGVTMMNFSEAAWFWAIGLACLPIGLVTGVVGLARFRRMNRSISMIRSQSREAETPGVGDVGR